MTRARWIGVFLLLVVAGIAHVAWWYVPREHPSRPSAHLALPLLEDERHAVRLWIPYPHQNLASWERRGELTEEWVSSVARLAGVETDPGAGRLPGYGPFRVPPASEIVAVWSEDGSLSIAARVYPAWAAIGRLAGRVAGNPWLSGGVVELSDRPATVSWRGRTWSVSTAQDADDLTPRESSGEIEPGLLALAVASPALPSVGIATLRRTPAGLELRGEGGAPDDVERSLEDGWRLLAEGDVLLVGRASRSDPTRSALLLDGGGIGAGVLSLPSALAVAPPAGERWELPAEGLARRLGLSPRERATEGWRLVAYDRDGLARAEATLGQFADLLGADGPPLAFWLRPDELHAVAEGLASALERLPLVPSSEARRWRDVERALRPLARHDRLACVFGARGGLLLRLEEPPSD